MAIQNTLIMSLLRLITPEEIAEVATKHNGGKFLSLTDLVNERVDHKIYRDFSNPGSMDEIHEQHNQSTQAKILPFKKLLKVGDGILEENSEIQEELISLTGMSELGQREQGEISKTASSVLEHKENENMSSFILIEKARLQRSQHILKQKEIIDLYQKNSHVDVEQIKGSNNNPEQSREAGVLINKKHY